MPHRCIVIEMRNSQADLRIIIAESLELQPKLRAMSTPVLPEEERTEAAFLRTTNKRRATWGVKTALFRCQIFKVYLATVFAVNQLIQRGFDPRLHPLINASTSDA